MKRQTRQHSISKRSVVPIALIVCVSLVLVVRAFQLQVYQRVHWQRQGEARFLRTVDIVAHRGVITDRYGDPLAISTPLESVWANPQILKKDLDGQQRLAKLVNISPQVLRRKLEQHQHKNFIYIKRLVSPEMAAKVRLEIAAKARPLVRSGIGLQREYKRFYPDKEITAHIIGFTNIDDAGQEGIELAYDHKLRGVNGSKQVIKDREGNAIEYVGAVSAPQSGEELKLSIDKSIQYLAHKELAKAVTKHRAKAGSLVVLDTASGEVLAMVNQPSYNPHLRDHKTYGSTRNRAVTDVFEPGSTIKPFIIAAALSSGRFVPESIIDTTPGFMQVGNRRIKDVRDYGRIDLTALLRKSSNVAASKIALTLQPKFTWKVLANFGFGKPTKSGFPGEVSGVLRHYTQWTQVDRAILAYGYGVSMTALKLAQCYAALANRGRMVQVSFTKRQSRPVSVQVISPSIAHQVSSMLEAVVEQGGTGQRANVKGYRIAGKTGTVRKVVNGQYVQGQYVALFAGFAPVTQPRLAMVVVVDTPTRAGYYGGTVAAPVFAQVMSAALRRLNVMPDNLPNTNVQIASRNQGKAYQQ